MHVNHTKLATDSLNSGLVASSAPMPAPKASMLRNVAIVATVLALVVLGSVYYLFYYNRVTILGVVDGTALTLGVESIDYIRFTAANGNTYSAEVNNRYFSIEVPNNTHYGVSIVYTRDLYPGLGSSLGTYQTQCGAGTYDVQAVTGRIVQNFSCF